VTGVGMIAEERKRQIEEEEWTPEHDDEHTGGSLALAAVCFAAPTKLYRRIDTASGITFVDPWPESWAWQWDRRFRYGTCRYNPGNVRPDPETYTYEERVDLLTKAGALIAAEIDRLVRRQERVKKAASKVSDMAQELEGSSE
jgi:hypothetical protein